MTLNVFEESERGRTVAEELGATQSERLSRLLATVDKQRIALQNTETSLVTRIADIDDEQRRATSQINKKYEALNSSLKATRILAIALVFSVILITMTVLGVFYMRTDRVHVALMADIAELRDMANTLQRQLPENTMNNKMMQERLAQLSDHVAELKPAIDALPAVKASMMPAPPPEVVSAAPEPTPSLPVSIPAPPEPIQEPVPFNPALDREPTPIVPSSSATHSSPSTASPKNTEKVVAVSDTLYSLQLIGFFSFAELIAYTQRVPLPPQVYYQTETFRGRPWFVLIHSLHNSYASAKATIAQFPPVLAELDVWIRKLPADATLTALDIQTTPAPAQP